MNKGSWVGRSLVYLTEEKDQCGQEAASAKGMQDYIGKTNRDQPLQCLATIFMDFDLYASVPWEAIQSMQCVCQGGVRDIIPVAC